jgi:exonuclease III
MLASWYWFMSVFFMDYNINMLVWKVLCWNIRGLNAHDKQLALFNKIVESGCAVACVQETKKENFDRHFIKQCCPKQFDTFAFSPSVGASGGHSGCMEIQCF